MTHAASPAGQPWAPICTIHTASGSHIVEGIIYVWAEDRTLFANAGRALLRVGNTRMPLASRSLLNPFLLMTWMPALQAAYPDLTDAHYALLMNNRHDPALRQELQAIASLAGFSGDVPAGGLELAYGLYRNTPNAVSPADALLEELLAYLLNPEEMFAATDTIAEPGPMRPFTLSPVEMAQLVHALILPMSRDLIRQCPDELTDVLGCWDRVAGIMRRYPDRIGGPERLDTRLVQAGESVSPALALLGLYNPDRMLCLGIGPYARFADGLGIYVQLAPEAVCDVPPPDLFSAILAKLLPPLGLQDLLEAVAGPDAEIECHFMLQDNSLSSRP